jgi:hypothetical protein
VSKLNLAQHLLLEPNTDDPSPFRPTYFSTSCSHVARNAPRKYGPLVSENLAETESSPITTVRNEVWIWCVWFLLCGSDDGSRPGNSASFQGGSFILGPSTPGTHHPPMLTKKQQWRRTRAKDSGCTTPGEDGTPNTTVSFSNRLRVILIPCREEYHACGIHRELWWQATDYLQFKNDAKDKRFFSRSQDSFESQCQCEDPSEFDSLFPGDHQPFHPVALFAS